MEKWLLKKDGKENIKFLNIFLCFDLKTSEKKRHFNNSVKIQFYLNLTDYLTYLNL